jgi:hypothetical protein
VRGAIPVIVALAACLALALSASEGLADATEDSLALDAGSPTSEAATEASGPRAHTLESLAPDIAAHPYRLAPGLRPYRNRLSVSPAYGDFGTDRYYALRVAYNPQSWFGYEAAIGHTPGHAVHAVLHTLSAVVRRPRAGRLQPYLTGGYGMVIVFPGQAVNAVSVTKNAVTVGGGLELYLRSDLALRGDLRQATVFGEQRNRDGIVVYQYSQGTLGLSFYRSVQP